MKNLDFAGNKRVLDKLGCLIDSGRFPHALIIEGERGLGKKALASQLAAALVCRADEKPCMQCSQCKKAVRNIHPDIFHYGSDGTANSFHIETVRKVINDSYIQPNEAECKVYILANADSMSIPAQNAFLKVMEEPPSYVTFILTASNKSKLLPTVLSRSVTVSLESVEINEGTDYLMSRLDNPDREKIKSTLEACSGNIGKALDALQEGQHSEISKICNDICESLSKHDEYLLLTACSAFQNDRQAVIYAAEFLKNMFRDALVNNGELISGQTQAVKLLKNSLTKQKLVDLIAVCDKLKETAVMNLNISLLITNMCYSLIEAAGS